MTNLVAFGDIPHYYASLGRAEAPAVSYPDATLSWSLLERRASQRARAFRDRGVVTGDYVTVALPNITAFHEIAFAIWKCGAIINVVSPRLPRHELEAIRALVKPRVVVGMRTSLEWVPELLDPHDNIERFSDEPFEASVFKYWKAMTSGGSTGRPKIIVDHKPSEIDLDEPALVQRFHIRPGMTILNPGPLYHNAPFILSHLSLFVGCKVIGMERFDAEEALRLIAEHKVNWVTFVPTMMHRIWSLPQQVRERYDVSSLEYVWHMAASCPPWLKQSWIEWIGAERIWELYGGTEGIGGTVIRGDDWLRHRGSVGKPADLSAIKVVGENGERLASGETGEIFFRVPAAATMPYHYIGATPKKDREGWESLGDLGWLDDEGYLYLADRRTDLILRGGANVYPAEVEAALDAHPDVGSSVVISVPCDDLGHRVHAIVQPRADAKLDLNEVQAFAEQRLAKYKLPESYELASEPLRDDAGKVRRSSLRDQRLEWLKQGREFRIHVTRPKKPEA